MRLGKYLAIADKLTGEYREAFDYIGALSDAYMNGGKYNNEKMMDLLDILLTAQDHGQPVEKVLGADLDKFSKDFFSDRTFYDLIEPAFAKLKVLAWLLLVIEGIYLISIIGEPGFNLFKAKSDVKSYAGCIVVSYLGIIVADIISIVLIKLKFFSNKKYVTMTIIFTLAALGIYIFVASSDYRIMVTIFPLVASSALYLAAFYGLRFYLRYKKTGTLKKPVDDYEDSFIGLMIEEAGKIDYRNDKDILKTYNKAYKKANRKRERKGLEPLSTEEFIRKRERENKYAFPISAGVCTAAAFLTTLLLEGFVNVYEGVLFVIICIGVPYLIYRFIIRGLIRVSTNVGRSILKKCREEGLELDELYEKYKDFKNGETEENSRGNR